MIGRYVPTTDVVGGGILKSLHDVFLSMYVSCDKWYTRNACKKKAAGVFVMAVTHSGYVYRLYDGWFALNAQQL